MKKLYRLYVFSLSGALGGLAASLLHEYLLMDVLTKELTQATRFVYLALLGALVGLSIGFFPCFVEGRGNYSFGGAIRTGVTGAVLGGVSGLMALPMGEWLHAYLGGGFEGRMAGWVLLGVFIGVSVGIGEGIIGGARPWRGIFGGIVGGALAGLSLELLVSYQVTHAESGVFALLLLGVFIAFFISLFVNVLSDAWLEGQPGSKVHGQIYHLGKFREPLAAILGSDKKGMVFIYIPDAEASHAAITLTDRGARLQHMAEKGITRVNGLPVKERILRDGEMIEIGHSRLRYRERRRATAVTSVPVNLKTQPTSN
jgi:hypothetical protein